jgi:hypothetical protein
MSIKIDELKWLYEETMKIILMKQNSNFNDLCLMDKAKEYLDEIEKLQRRDY